MNDRLQTILDAKRRHVATQREIIPEAELKRRVLDQTPARGFAAALRRKVAHGGYGLIAEMKRTSPSKGRLRDAFEPDALARAMHEGGAACLSVLTDEPFFEGADAHLESARSAVPIPALRKDFILERYQIFEARALGADCVLLIMAVLDDVQAELLTTTAQEMGMDVLIEVHDERELDRAMSLTPDLIGINNRNLRTFEVDLGTSERLAALASGSADLVAESGLAAPADLERLADAGIVRFLIGETLMRASDVTAAVRSLLASKAQAA